MIHPAPGSDGRPSFTALIGKVDSNTAKYIAPSRVQASRVGIIEDLQGMTNRHVLSMYMKYRQFVEKKTGNLAPARLIFTETVCLKANSSKFSDPNSRQYKVLVRN